MVSMNLINRLEKIIVYLIITFVFLNRSSLEVGDFRFPILQMLLVSIGLIYFTQKKFLLKSKSKEEASHKIFNVKTFKKVVENLTHQKIRSYIRENFLTLFIVVWILYGGLSIFWVRDLVGWRISFNSLIIGGLCVFSFQMTLKTKADILNAFKILMIISMVQNVIGWFEVVFNTYVFLPYNASVIWQNRPVSWFQNTNNFAVFLFLSVGISYINMKMAKNKIFYTLNFLLMLSSITLTFFTGSRGAIMGLLISVLLLLILEKRWYKYVLAFLKKNRTSIIVSISVLSLVAIFILENIFFSGYRSSSAIIRMNLIKNGFLFLGRTFGLGVGAGNIEYWMSNYSVYNTYGIINMHNWWMEIAVSFGVPIFILYCYFYYRLIKDYCLKLNDSTAKTDQIVAIATLSMLSGFVVIAMIPSSLMPHIFHWACFGLFVSHLKSR